MLVIWRERGRARHGGYEGEDKGGIDETGRVLGGEEISRVPAAMARIEWWYLGGGGSVGSEYACTLSFAGLTSQGA